MSKENVPKTFFQLVLKFLRRLAKRLVWRIVFGVISFIAVFFLHTYLMVVINDTLYFVENNKILSMILNLVSRNQQTKAQTFIQKINAYLFWIMIAGCIFGSIARMVSYGIKGFFAEIVYIWTVAYESFRDRSNKTVFLRIITGVVIGIIVGTFLFNSMVSLVASVFVLLSASQQERSMVVLALTLIKSDWQRYLKIKNPKIFNMDGFIVVAIGISIGLLVSAAIPGEIFGNSMGSIVLKMSIAVGIIVLATIGVRNKKVANLFVIFIPIGIAILLWNLNVLADDTGWSESGRNMKGWLNNSGTPLAIRLGVSPALLSSLASVLGTAYPGFIKDMLSNPKMNPYEYIRKNLTSKQHEKVKDKVKDYNQMGIDAAIAEAEAFNSTLGFWGNFFEGCGKDMSEIGGAVKEFSETLVVELPTYVWNNKGEALKNSTTFVGEVGTAVSSLAGDAANAAGDLFANNGEVLIATIKMTATDLLTDPIGSAEKVAKNLYETSGLKELNECTDPNRSATERAGLYSVGVIKLWGLIDGAGAAADMSKVGARAALSKLSTLSDDLIKIAGGSKDDLVRMLGKSKEEVAQMMNKAGAQMSPDDLERLYIHKLNTEAGEATTKRLIDAIDSGDDDLLKKVLDIQQDKSAMKALNELEKTRPDIIKKFNSKLKEVYKSVDDDTVTQLAKRNGWDPKDVEVLKATNKAKTSGTGKIKAGMDRDVTIRYKGKDVKPGDWEDLYRKNLFEKTKHNLPDGINEGNIMERLDQTAIDKMDLESYGSNESAFEKIIDGKTHDIANSSQVGDAITHKATKHFDEAVKLKNLNPAQAEKEICEGMRQLTKQWDNQIEGAAQKYVSGTTKTIAKPSQRLKKAVDIMREATEKGQSAVQVERALKMMDYTKEQVAREVGEHFDAIIKLGKRI